jgi:hypothetical protein
MENNKRHIQLRLSPKMHKELNTTAGKYQISVAELIRGVLYLGLPVFDTLTDLRYDLVERLVKVLKKDARQDKTTG